MSITKLPVKKDAAEAFIAGAPDGQTTVVEAGREQMAMRGKQAQITLTLPPDLLARANAVAGQLSLSRAAFFKLAITRAVQAEGGIDG
jgi:hypothetical protein